MNFKEAKLKAKNETDPNKKDWRTLWKYGKIVKGLGIGHEGITFDWGKNATPQQKELLIDCIDNITKWASKVETILDDPPSLEHRKLFKEMKRLKLRGN